MAHVDPAGGRSVAAAAVHSLDHFGLGVPALADAQRFYEGFGLGVRPERAGLGVYARSEHRWAVVHEAPRKHLAWLSFACHERDLPDIAARVRAHAAETATPPPGGPQEGLWFHDRDGTCVHVGSAPKSSPDAKAAGASAAAPAGARGACNRSAAPTVRPSRLSHVLCFTPDVMAAVAFYRDVLGLRLSDHSGEGIAFMHAIHGSDHHLLAFARSTAPGYHHSSWIVGSLEEVGLGGMQMAARGHTRGWGPGRHSIGSNHFWYVQDPWGSFAEYSANIDYVPAGSEWPATDHPPDDAFYLWGPPPPEDFVTNHEAAAR